MSPMNRDTSIDNRTTCIHPEYEEMMAEPTETTGNSSRESPVKTILKGETKAQYSQGDSTLTDNKSGVVASNSAEARCEQKDDSSCSPQLDSESIRTPKRGSKLSIQWPDTGVPTAFKPRDRTSSYDQKKSPNTNVNDQAKKVKPLSSDQIDSSNSVKSEKLIKSPLKPENLPVESKENFEEMSNGVHPSLPEMKEEKDAVVVPILNKPKMLQKQELMEPNMKEGQDTATFAVLSEPTELQKQQLVEADIHLTPNRPIEYLPLMPGERPVKPNKHVERAFNRPNEWLSPVQNVQEITPKYKIKKVVDDVELLLEPEEETDGQEMNAPSTVLDSVGWEANLSAEPARAGSQDGCERGDSHGEKTLPCTPLLDASSASLGLETTDDKIPTSAPAKIEVVPSVTPPRESGESAETTNPISPEDEGHGPTVSTRGSLRLSQFLYGDVIAPQSKPKKKQEQKDEKKEEPKPTLQATFYGSRSCIPFLKVNNPSPEKKPKSRSKKRVSKSKKAEQKADIEKSLRDALDDEKDPLDVGDPISLGSHVNVSDQPTVSVEEKAAKIDFEDLKAEEERNENMKLWKSMSAVEVETDRPADFLPLMKGERPEKRVSAKHMERGFNRPSEWLSPKKKPESASYKVIPTDNEADLPLPSVNAEPDGGPFENVSDNEVQHGESPELVHRESVKPELGASLPAVKEKSDANADGESVFDVASCKSSLVSASSSPSRPSKMAPALKSIISVFEANQPKVSQKDSRSEVRSIASRAASDSRKAKLPASNNLPSPSLKGSSLEGSSTLDSLGNQPCSPVSASDFEEAKGGGSTMTEGVDEPTAGSPDSEVEQHETKSSTAQLFPNECSDMKDSEEKKENREANESSAYEHKDDAKLVRKEMPCSAKEAEAPGPNLDGSEQASKERNSSISADQVDVDQVVLDEDERLWNSMSTIEGKKKHFVGTHTENKERNSDRKEIWLSPAQKVKLGPNWRVSKPLNHEGLLGEQQAEVISVDESLEPAIKLDWVV